MRIKFLHFHSHSLLAWISAPYTYYLLVILFTSALSCETIADLEQLASKNHDIIKDYGVHGALFPIEEESLVDEIMGKLEAANADGTFDRLQEEFTEKVKKKILRPAPVLNIKKATENRSWTYDPTFTQNADIKDDKGRVIIPAGTSVNALDKLKWGDPVILIDGDDKAQVRWASSQRAIIVLTNGAPLELAKHLNLQIYFDQGGLLCRQFNIESVPAIIEQDGTLLRISEVRI
jgi:conjugal transfer pilus assembly protein TraW